MGRAPAAVIATLLAACAGSATSAQAPEAKSGVERTAPEVGAEAIAVDLSPAPEPADLQFVLHVPAAARWSELSGLLSGAYPTLDGLLELEPREIAESSLDPRLVELIDFSKPLHVSQGGGESDPKLTVSLPLSGTIETVRERWSGELSIRKTAPGVYSVEMAPSGTALACELRQSAGPAALRMVCGSDAASVALHGAYLTRTAARASTPALARVELPRGAFRRLVRSAARESMEVPLRPAEKLGSEIAERLFDDVDSVALELDRAGDRMSLTLEIAFRAAKSLLSIALASAPGVSASDAQALWRMPRQALLAAHFSGADRKRLREPAHALIDAVFGTLPDEIVDAQGRQEVGAKAKQLFLTGGPITAAYGLDTTRARKALSAPRRDELPLARVRAATAGWTLIHVAEPAEHWTRGLRELLAADARATARLASRPASAASGQSRSAALAHGRYLSATREQPIRASDRLPSGSLHLVTSYTPNPRYLPITLDDLPAGSAHESHVFLAPEAGQTWFSLSEDAALALAKLREVLAKNKSGTLKQEPELESLGAARGSSFGFVTLEGFAFLALSADSRRELDEGATEIDQLAALGALATTRWPLVTTATGAQPPLRLRFTTSAGRPALAEIVRVLADELE